MGLKEVTRWRRVYAMYDKGDGGRGQIYMGVLVPTRKVINKVDVDDPGRGHVIICIYG